LIKILIMPVSEYKTAFSDLVYDIVREDISDIQFQGIMKFINSLICDKKEKELFRILKFHFPEYYNRIKPI